VTALSERLLVAALAWGAFSFGGVYPWAYWPLAAVCAVIGIRAVVATRAWKDHRARWLGIALAAVAGAIAIQLIALPYSLLERLSPAFDRFFREYALAYHPASLHALSLAPRATLVALALFVAFSLLLLGLTGALRHMSLEWLLNQVMGIGMALTIVGIIQRAFPFDPAHPVVYGFWEPRQGGNPFGPFINRNHFAGWMVMALPLVVGYACAVLAQTFPGGRPGVAAKLRWLMTVEASRFVLVGFCALMMGMALVLTGSRSGIASFAIAMMGFAYLAGRQFTSRRPKVVLAAALAVLLAGAIAWAGGEATISRFRLAGADSSGAGRIQAWQDTVRIIGDFPWFGTGLGTYGQAMLVYQTAGRPVMYAQAHNDYLQLVAEGGVLVVAPTVVTLALVLATLRRRLTPRRDQPMTTWVRAGAVAGLAGIAAQSFVEFSLQMPGNTALFVLVLAVALHRSAENTQQSPRSSRR
jgi:O-antigen ligase